MSVWSSFTVTLKWLYKLQNKSVHLFEWSHYSLNKDVRSVSRSSSAWFSNNLMKYIDIHVYSCTAEGIFQEIGKFNYCIARIFYYWEECYIFIIELCSRFDYMCISCQRLAYLKQIMWELKIEWKLIVNVYCPVVYCYF